MASRTYRQGAVQVYLPIDQPDITSSSLGTLAYTASAEAWTDANNNDIRGNLDTTATYQVILSALWHDPTNLGYGMVQASPGSGILSVTSGQGIRLSVAPGAWPANYSYASFITVWLKKNSGDFKLHSLYAPDTSNTWATMIITEAAEGAITKTSAFLQSTSTDEDYPKRTGLTGVAFQLAGISTGGVQIAEEAAQVQYSPDNSSDYQIATNRGFTLTFSTLNNNLSDIIKARAGEYAKFNVSGTTYEIGLRTFQTGSAIATGNRPVKVVWPIDNHKAAEVLYMAAALKENQTGGTMNTTKTDPMTLDYVIQTVNNDTTLVNVHCTSSRILYTA